MYVENLYILIAKMIELARRDARKRNADSAEAIEFLLWCETELSIYLKK